MAASARYGKWVDQGLSAKAVSPMHVKVRVLAIPQAGMGAWAFHGWQEKLPKSVEMLPVELPGRNSRMLEDRASPWPSSSATSLGAWMAFEVCNEIERRRGPKPLCLIVSGCRAPQLHEPLEHDADRDYVEPLLRSDFKILETCAGAASSLPVLGCGARGDNRFTPEQLTAWSVYTDTFAERWFDTAATMPKWSTPHRYLVDSPDAFVAFLGPKCEDLFKNKPKPPPIRPGAYAVANKKGALVRAECDLASAQVGDLLPVGTRVTVEEAVHVPNAKPRARISAPVAGWLSCHVIAQLLG
ncbi:dodecanoyl-[acyl-carrier-protein] hydrolase [Aureococcus anophagefferens]|nr:dodecanoyl-[acyl-carrier-protein] hydrolase [Aureococcus anophagefferens]